MSAKARELLRETLAKYENAQVGTKVLSVILTETLKQHNLLKMPQFGAMHSAPNHRCASCGAPRLILCLSCDSDLLAIKLRELEPEKETSKDEKTDSL